MASGTQAVEAFAAATGTLLATVDRASVALQAAREDLWPLGKRGGGRTTPHVEPKHLVNLALALACADPITASARVVRQYRHLRVAKNLHQEIASTRRELPDLPSEFPTWPGDVPRTPYDVLTRKSRDIPDGIGLVATRLKNFGVTLGDHLDGLVREALQSPLERDGLLQLGFSVGLTVDVNPQASVSIRYQLDDGIHTETSSYFPQSALGDHGSAPSRPPARPIRLVTLPFELFAVLADLWGDTLAHRKTKGATPARVAPSANGSPLFDPCLMPRTDEPDRLISSDLSRCVRAPSTHVPNGD